MTRPSSANFIGTQASVMSAITDESLLVIVVVEVF
jgi:hypothetical protein